MHANAEYEIPRALGMTRFVHAADVYPATVRSEAELISKLAILAKLAKMQMTS